MANQDHIVLLKKGVDAWNAWRDGNRDVYLDLSGADLGGANLTDANLVKANLSRAKLLEANLIRANLSGAFLTQAILTDTNLVEANLSRAELLEANLIRANLSGADLRGADLREANLIRTNLSGASLCRTFGTEAADLWRANLIRANLSGADLGGANLRKANLGAADLSKASLDGASLNRAYLRGADLREANLSGANLIGANLKEANLRGAYLYSAQLVDTDLTDADLTGSRIFGISVWRLKLERAKQQSLVITSENEPEITVDNIEIAQFIYLLLHNEKIRDVIDTIGTKGVLLLGHFTEGRIQILERLREKLRGFGFVPMVFNFDKAQTTKDFTETVQLLANLSHFVIVDITNPRSTLLELQAIVPSCMVPFVPIIEDGQEVFSMFVDLQKGYHWVLQPVHRYSSVERLIEGLEDNIVKRAEAKFNELLVVRTKQLRVEEM